MRHHGNDHRHFARATAALATMAAGALAVAAGSPAYAADGGTNGMIVFEQAHGNIVTLSGGTEHVLPAGNPNGAQQGPAAVSPDGTKLAFWCDYAFCVTTTAGTKVKLYHISGYPNSPTWSPNGTRIGYISGDGQIWTMAPTGTGLTRLTNGLSGIANPKWSPDNSRIVFDAPDANHNRQLYTVLATGAHTVKQLTSGNCNTDEPDWSPDATQLVFSTGCLGGAGPQIGRMPTAGGAMTKIAFYTEADAGFPSWSPDGATIVFSANEGMGSEQLWTSSPANTGGTGKKVTATQLTFDPGQPYNENAIWQSVHHATVTLSKASGAAGTTVTVSGADFLSEQTVKLTFVASNGTKTALATAHTPLAGTFSATVTIPATAAKGAGHIIATGVGGLKATATFTVS